MVIVALSACACSPLLQCGPEGVRRQHGPQEPVLSKQQTRPLPSYSH